MSPHEDDFQLDGAQLFENWDSLTQVAHAQPNPNDQEIDFALDNLDAPNNDAYWLNQFQKTNLYGMDLVALKRIAHYTHDFKSETVQKKKQMAVFLQHLPANHFDALRVAGLDEDQIKALFQGKLPINWTLHLKYSLAYGGTISEENFVLIPHYPFHEEIHRFLNQQILSDAGVITPPILYVPVPKTAVYVPYGTNEMATQVLHFNPKGGNT